jgi:hypothetical protein
MLDPKQFLKCRVIVSKETYAVAKAKKPMPNAFATIIDDKEITLIIDQSKINGENIFKVEKDWKLLTFDAALPFELVGFLATVAQTLAQANVSLFALSAYSRDHILVKAKDLEKSKKALSQLGCQIS